MGKILSGVCWVAVAVVPCCARAQAPVPAEEQAALTRTVSALDTKLFDAYNHCDLKTLGTMVSEDLEFYHDQTGLMVGKAPFLEAMQKNICGKVQRTLVAGSMEVYRLKGFGAVEIGVHRFRQPARPEEGEGEAKFISIWKNNGGNWVLTRVISYDHGSLTQK